MIAKTIVTQPTPTKEIKYDRYSKDFALFLNGEFVGYAASHLEGENKLNALAHDHLTRSQPATEADDTAARQLTELDEDLGLYEQPAAVVTDEADTDAAQIALLTSEIATPIPHQLLAQLDDAIERAYPEVRADEPATVHTYTCGDCIEIYGNTGDGWYYVCGGKAYYAENQRCWCKRPLPEAVRPAPTPSTEANAMRLVRQFGDLMHERARTWQCSMEDAYDIWLAVWGEGATDELLRAFCHATDSDDVWEAVGRAMETNEARLAVA